MVNIVRRYLSIAVAVCFVLCFYSWYSLSSSQTKGHPTVNTIFMADKFIDIQTDKTREDLKLIDQLQVHAEDLIVKRKQDRFLNSETEKEWVPKYYAKTLNNNSSLSYIRKRLLEYCNPPVKATTGMEGVVSSGYDLQSVHIIIRHGDRTPLENSGMGISADINCNLMIVSDVIPDPLFELLATDFNEWKELLKKEDELMLSDMKLKKSLRNCAVGSLNLNYLSATISDSNKCRTSQLTPNGWRQHLANGAFLRKAYEAHNLLNPKVSDYKSFMNLQTTSYSRTMQSAIALLYGLLPEDQILKTPPLKINSFLNFCQGSTCNCPAASQLLNLVASEKSKHKIEYPYTRQLTKDIKSRLYGKQKDLSKLPHFFALLDHFTSFLCHDQKLPCGPLSCVELDQVQEIFKYIDKLENDLKSHEDSASMRHAKLSMHPLLTEVTNSIIENKTNHRFSLYSGHDLTITPFLALLGLKDFHWPNYASRIVIEAWSRSTRKFIRVLYNGVDVTSKIVFCFNKLNEDGLCPLIKLVEFINVQNLFNENSYKEACLSKNM